MELINVKYLDIKSYFEKSNGEPELINSAWIQKLRNEKIITFDHGSMIWQLYADWIIKINKNAINIISAYVSAFEELIQCSIKCQKAPNKHSRDPSDKLEQLEIRSFLPFINENFPHDEPIADYLLRLNSEWIRHMNSLFFKKNTVDDTTEFFPYDYQDHICHSFVVTILGKMFLNSITLKPDTIRNIIDILLPSDPNYEKLTAFLQRHELNSSGDLEQIKNSLTKVLKNKNLLCIINFIYYVKGYIDIDHTEIYSKWSKHVWEFIGLWHDSGYDNYTFSFLLNDSFNHNKAISIIPSSFFDCLEMIKSEILDPLKKFPLTDEFREDFNSALRLSEKNGKDISAFIKGFEMPKRDRHFGRAHALFSGFEFISRYNELISENKNNLGDLTPNQLNLISFAIIEHHEKNGIFIPESELNMDSSKSNDQNQIEQTVQLFVRNPLGHLLRFCDSIAGFARIDINWDINSPDGNGKKIEFKYENDKRSVEIKPYKENLIPLYVTVKEERCKGRTDTDCESNFSYYLFATVETIQEK